jgi:hypothetical protein
MVRADIVGISRVAIVAKASHPNNTNKPEMRTLAFFFLLSHPEMCLHLKGETFKKTKSPVIDWGFSLMPSLNITPIIL